MPLGRVVGAKGGGRMAKSSGGSGKKGEVRIKETCRGCGICVEFCERGVLAMDVSGKEPDPRGDGPFDHRFIAR